MPRSLVASPPAVQPFSGGGAAGGASGMHFDQSARQAWVVVEQLADLGAQRKPRTDVGKPHAVKNVKTGTTRASWKRPAKLLSDVKDNEKLTEEQFAAAIVKLVKRHPYLQQAVFSLDEENSVEPGGDNWCLVRKLLIEPVVRKAEEPFRDPKRWFLLESECGLSGNAFEKVRWLMTKDLREFYKRPANKAALAHGDGRLKVQDEGANEATGGGVYTNKQLYPGVDGVRMASAYAVDNVRKGKMDEFGLSQVSGGGKGNDTCLVCPQKALERTEKVATVVWVQPPPNPETGEVPPAYSERRCVLVVHRDQATFMETKSVRSQQTNMIIRNPQGESGQSLQGAAWLSFTMNKEGSIAADIAVNPLRELVKETHVTNAEGEVLPLEFVVCLDHAGQKFNMGLQGGGMTNGSHTCNGCTCTQGQHNDMGAHMVCVSVKQARAEQVLAHTVEGVCPGCKKRIVKGGGGKDDAGTVALLTAAEAATMKKGDRQNHAKAHKGVQPGAARRPVARTVEQQRILSHTAVGWCEGCQKYITEKDLLNRLHVREHWPKKRWSEHARTHWGVCPGQGSLCDEHIDVSEPRSIEHPDIHTVDDTVHLFINNTKNLLEHALFGNVSAANEEKAVEALLKYIDDQGLPINTLNFGLGKHKETKKSAFLAPKPTGGDAYNIMWAAKGLVDTALPAGSKRDAVHRAFEALLLQFYVFNDETVGDSYEERVEYSNRVRDSSIEVLEAYKMAAGEEHSGVYMHKAIMHMPAQAFRYGCLSRFATQAIEYANAVLKRAKHNGAKLHEGAIIDSMLKQVGKEHVGTKRKCTMGVPAQVLVKVLTRFDEMHADMPIRHKVRVRHYLQNAGWKHNDSKLNMMPAGKRAHFGK